jgi:hypothetical protein
VVLNCGLHKCTSSCHQLSNHSKVRCTAVFHQKCSNGHSQTWKCYSGAPPVCSRCDHDRKEAEKKAQRAVEEQLRRDERQQKHLREIAKIEEEIEQINQGMRDKRIQSEQQAILAQKNSDLRAAKERTNNIQSSHHVDSPSIYNNSDPEPRNLAPKRSSQSSQRPASSSQTKHTELQEEIKAVMEHNKSASKTEWQRQKDQENAHNPAIDKIMEMIGLEEVKSQVLRIKAKVETSIRQGTDLKKERFGLVLLGNPGTGIFFPSFLLMSYDSNQESRENHCSQALRKSSDVPQSPLRGWIH